MFLNKDGKAFRRRKASRNVNSAGVRPSRRGPRDLDRFRVGHLLGRLRRRNPNAWLGNRFHARFNNKDQYPISAKSGSWNTRHKPDRVTAKLAAVHFYQLSIPAPKAPSGHMTRPRSNDWSGFERTGGTGHCPNWSEQRCVTR